MGKREFVQNVATSNGEMEPLGLPVYDFTRNKDNEDGGNGVSGHPAELRVLECPECGFKFTPQGQTPLGLPMMPIGNRKEPALDQAEAYEGFSKDTPVICPRCGATVG